MRRDSLFYRLFAQSPDLLFDLLQFPPEEASHYRFDSVAVKEPKFEIDGVFLPPENSDHKTVYFCEVQFQKDDQLYERLFGELFLYFYRQRQLFDDWQAVVIYPSRSIEQDLIHPYRSLLDSEQVHRIYLKELGTPDSLPIGIGLLVLTTLSKEKAPDQARTLLRRVQQEEQGAQQQGIIELITMIMAYRFTEKSRQEVEAMLGLTLQETRFYQEAKEEGREKGREEGREEGRTTEARSLILRLITRRFGDELPEPLVTQINALEVESLEQLGESLLDDLRTLDDVMAWLTTEQDGQE